MSILDRVIATVAPRRALDRARARMALRVMARYEAADVGPRNRVWRAASSDADVAARHRSRLAYVARDLVRNNAHAARAQAVIVNNVVGDGIIPKVRARSAAKRKELLQLIEAHFDTVDIDADGRNNLYGLQRLAMMTIVDSGEVLILRVRRKLSDGLALPFQLKVLEPDHLDRARDGTLPSGGEIREGIEYNGSGARVAYWMFEKHPGSEFRIGRSFTSQRIPADDVIHCYRQDRPGQMRGVTWFAPVAMALQDLHDYQDAQLMRQKIAACFAAFRVTPDGEPSDASDPAGLSTLVPGRVQNLAVGEDIRFANPPGVDGYDEFTRGVLASVASGLGITYEAMTGDLRRVNFTSGRLGRLEMARSISSWQWIIMVAQMMHPIGKWFLDAYVLQSARRIGSDIGLGWVPAPMPLVDPTREIPAKIKAIRAGLASQSGTIREMGHDPERLMEEVIADAKFADKNELVFDTDARRTSGAGQHQADVAPSREENFTDE